MTDLQSKSSDTIRSLSEYIQRISCITREEQKDHSQALFYRGHADSDWKLEPAVYRTYPGEKSTSRNKKSYRKVELLMYQEMLRRSPQAFQDCRTTFERLVKMQHYGLPTRLLDLTQSPLVALYFACCEKNEKDGEVLVIKAKKENVYFQGNLPSSALSEFNFQYQLKDVLKYISYQYISIITEIARVVRNIKIDCENADGKKEGYIRKILDLARCIGENVSIKDKEELYKCVNMHINKFYDLIKKFKVKLTHILTKTNPIVSLLNFMMRIMKYSKIYQEDIV
ncbi:MAG: FRG domain-containing protein [Alistipes senegalensis]|nr:FRG domain-containing protein [Oxalobacter formigenes]MCM1280887.1 FRG domain-containing protein [Alistipes senegalensis]